MGYAASWAVGLVTAEELPAGHVLSNLLSHVRCCCAALRLCPLVVSCSIKQLTKLISDLAPAAIKEETLAELNGRKIAIDASMAIYQFLVRGESP
jgi:hypothetical protein